MSSNNSKVGQYKFAYQAKNIKEYNHMLNNLENYLLYEYYPKGKTGVRLF